MSFIPNDENMMGMGDFDAGGDRHGGGRDGWKRSTGERQLVFRPLEVEVKDNLEKAMKALKQKMSKEGVLQELKRRRFYEKPSVKRKRKMREALKRRRKAMRKRLQSTN